MVTLTGCMGGAPFSRKQEERVKEGGAEKDLVFNEDAEAKREWGKEGETEYEMSKKNRGEGGGGGAKELVEEQKMVNMQ